LTSITDWSDILSATAYLPFSFGHAKDDRASGNGSRHGRFFADALLAAHRYGKPARKRTLATVRDVVDLGRYWLTRLQSRTDSPAMAAFRAWLCRP
jgi:hypothetical protein